MKVTFTVAFFQAAGVRAIKTFAQTAVTLITVGQAFMEVNWINVISIAATSAVMSILTSIAGGIPLHRVHHYLATNGWVSVLSACFI